MAYTPGASAYVWREYFRSLVNIHVVENDRSWGEDWCKDQRTEGTRIHISWKNLRKHLDSHFDDNSILSSSIPIHRIFLLQVNVIMHYGRQQNVTFLNTVNNETGYFDVIIDDDGHTMTQQIRSIMCLLNSITNAFIKRLVDDIQEKSPLKSTYLVSRLATFENTDKICIRISYCIDS